MIRLRKSEERGHIQNDWLDTKHSFSFGDYYDPEHMHFRSLRVINEDIVEPGKGFAPHSHRDMEIITYILSGALEHQDSMGNGSVIRAGEVQYMSAGKGVTHSEFNHSPTTKVHLLQIWIFPHEKAAEPRYAQMKADTSKDEAWKLLASQNGEQGSIAIRQDAKLLLGCFGLNQSMSYLNQQGRFQWVQVAKGSVELNSTRLNQGDGAALEDEKALRLTSLSEETEVLLFDLA